MKKKALWVMLGLGVVGVAGFALRSGEGARADVSVAGPRGVVAPARVETRDDVIDLAFELQGGGRVVEVLVKEGDRVEAGQVLARLDDRLARARVARAEAAVMAAEARRDLSYRGARANELRAAEAELAAARAAENDREASQGRAERLLAGGAVGAADADSARASADGARAQASAAAARLGLLKEGTRRELRREADAALSAARAELEENRTLLAHTELRAPRAGVILRRRIEPGEFVSTMPPVVVLSMADVSQLELRAEVDESDVGRVEVGQFGYATAEAYGDRRFPGRVLRLTGELGRKQVVVDDPRARIDTRVLEVMFQLDEGAPEQAQLPLGLRMELHLTPGVEAATVAASK